jgi:hypothetical protein
MVLMIPFNDSKNNFTKTLPRYNLMFLFHFCFFSSIGYCASNVVVYLAKVDKNMLLVLTIEVNMAITQHA